MAGIPTCTTPSSSAGSAASRVPTLVLWGASDGIVTPAYGRAYARSFPGARFELIDRGRAPPGDRAGRELRRPRRALPGALTFRTETGRDAMDAWWQCEVPYPFVPHGRARPRRIPCAASLPNRYCDPQDRRRSLRRGDRRVPALRRPRPQRRWPSSITPASTRLLGANPMLVGILARQTRKARILSLGTLISLRQDPVRVAEEYATADVISRGRLEIGFVKSGGTEMASGQRQPGQQRRALLGGDRPHHQGAHPSGRAVQLGGQALHAPPRQHLAAALAAAASAPVGGDRRSGHRRRGRPSRHGATCWCCAARRGRGARMPPTARRARRPACRRRHDRQLRLRGLRLCRRHRRGRPARRQQAPVVPATRA